MVQESNPNGAIVAIDGVSLMQNTGLVFYLSSLGSITKTLTIAKGPSAVLNDRIGIVLTTLCGDLSDTVWANVQFTPSCTNVTLAEPLGQWVMNTETGSSLLAEVKDFNRNEQNFQSVSIEYKPSSSSTWLPLIFFFNDSTSQVYKDCQSQKSIIKGSAITYAWDASNSFDQKYDIRARSNCADNIYSYSTIAMGVKDMTNLQVFGTPQPSTGILGIGENISVQFNKPIEGGMIMDNYVQVNGILNGSPVAHAASLNFDGASGYAKADGFCFTGQPFTVEFWMKRDNIDATGVIFSKGVSDAEKIEIANTTGGNMRVTLGSKSIDVDPSKCYTTEIPNTSWHHYALSYDTSGTVNVFADDQIVLTQFGVKYSPQERGSIYLGRSASGSNFGQAYVDEVRIWNAARSKSDVYANMSQLLSGSQQGLVAYWPLNEGAGALATDRAASHTLTINTSWKIALQNEAVQFDATKNQALIVNTRQLTLSKEQDATIEFWFKAPIQASRACLLYNGVKDSTANGYNPDAFGLFLEPSTGLLTLTAGGKTANATNGNVCDNAWHHFAMVIDRLSNVRTYLDGNLQSQLSAALFAEIVGLDMSIGAYHMQATSQTSVTKQYFTGMIDELRIWETARNATLIKKYMHTKLQGTETGLLYYFPFEAYYNMSNVQVLGTTLKNNVDSAAFIADGLAKTDTVQARIINGAQYTTQSPAVKDAQPTTNLAVTYEVNNDKLLINLPTQYASLYENCVLDISVRNIFDKNGNKLSSPVQWTAFINQNPVIWSKASDTLTILAGQGGTLTANVVNKGGVAKDFTINGLPAWLTASPESGTVQPNNTQTITFIVNSGLNIGSYSVPINLTTDYGYDEKLQLNVTVKAKAPDWKVDPNKFQYSMNVFGKVQIAGVIATNENDMVAAFVGTECRGVTTLKYLSDFDITEAMLTIYSNNQSGDAVSFLVWDANTGQIYTDVTPKYSFTSDQVYGTPKSPVLISCGSNIRNSYSFNAGWNWISINVIPQTKTVESVLSSVGKNGDMIKGQQSVFDQFDTKAGGWSGSLTKAGGLNPVSMYKLDLANAGTAAIDGTPADPTALPLSIKLGWNWIGFIPQFNISANEALASYGPQDGDIVKSQRAFSIYYTGIGWVGTLNVLQPGLGYMLQSAKNSTLLYPKRGLLQASKGQNTAQPFNMNVPKVLGFTGGQAETNATILAQVADSTIDLNGKVLAAYSGSICSGFAIPVTIENSKPLFFLVADKLADSSNLTFALVDTSTGVKTHFTNTLKMTSDGNTG